MMRWTGLATLAVLGLATIAQAMPQGGIFIPRNGGYEGCMGKAHVFFNQSSGGMMSVVQGSWPQWTPLAKMDMVFALKIKGAAGPVEARQSFDKSPQIIFLEEGNDRIGLRVLFKIYDAGNVYHGHGMTETWLYPDGQMFITAAATFENSPAHEAIQDARVDLKLAPGYGPQGLTAATAIDDKAWPARMVSLGPVTAGTATPALSLYWRSGKMEHNTFPNRSSFGLSGAPTYFRWPDYFRQAYGMGGWANAITASDQSLQIRFPVDASKPNPAATFNTLFRLALADAAQTKAFVEAEREPPTLAVTGGIAQGAAKGQTGSGYNDQEGCYEIRKTADPMVLTLPADAQGRTLRVKAIALEGHGGIAVDLDGKALIPQLTSDGGIADDPLAPIREQPEAPADAAMVSVQLTGKPQTLTFREQPGVQMVYQVRDTWRNIAVYSSKTGPRWSGLRFSLVDGHARNMRAYGTQDWALSENLLTWFSYCGYTPENMVDQIRDFVILKNGPDEAVFRYTSANANDGAQSTYTVALRADAPAMQINVVADFKVLEQWPYTSAQFFDVFPFRGVWTHDWWYPNVLWLTPEGKWKTMDTVKATYDGQADLASITGGGFFGLYSSDRGNMLMLTKNFKPLLPTEYVICGNYIDYHMDLKFVGADGKPIQPSKGFTASCEYELAIWGGKSLTRDQLIAIGNQSIKAGKLVIPNTK